MNEKVLPFPLSVVKPKIGEPNPRIIERLESLLEKAKSGEIQGFAYAISMEVSQATGWEVEPLKFNDLLCSVFQLHHRFGRAALGEKD